MTDLLYLDYNCFQRGFDDLEQTRIKMEALACQEIAEDAKESITAFHQGNLKPQSLDAIVAELRETLQDN